MVPPHHQLQRKRQKKVHEYYQKPIDDCKLIIMNPSPNLSDQEKRSIATYFGCSSQDQCIETNTKIILTRVLNHWNENNSIAHLSACALYPAETVALKIYSIELN